MLRWLLTNLRTLFLAFILAMAVWVSAVTAADPDETRQLETPIAIEYTGQDPGLVITGTIPHQAEVTLRAPHSVWEQLDAIEDSVRVVVDLSGLEAGMHTVQIQVQVSARPVRLISASPREFNLMLEPLARRSLPVIFETTGELPIGYQAGSVELSVSEVTVSGASTIVSNVESVHAVLDLTGIRQNVQTTLSLVARDDQGVQLEGLTFTPESVQVTLPVSQQGGYRDLAVKVVVRGHVASGYRLTSIAVFPPVITVFSANSALIISLPGYVETMPLDLSNASADIETHLNLNLPQAVTLVGEQTVRVQISISAIQSSMTISYRPVEVIGLGEGLEASITTQRVDIILSGPLPVLDTLSTSDIRITVDASGLSPGTYQLTPSVEILVQDILVESILPGTVEVIISGPGTPTH